MLSNTLPVEPTLPRRLKAAMELAGYASAEDLAQAIGEYGLGASTLRKFLRGEREPRLVECRLMADACGVPEEFLRAENLWNGWKHGPAGTNNPEQRLAVIQAQAALNGSMLTMLLSAVRDLGAQVPDHLISDLSSAADELEAAGEGLDAAHRALASDLGATDSPG